MSGLAEKVEQQWATMVRRGPYVLLAVGTALSVLLSSAIGTTDRIPWFLALAAVAAVLHYVCVDRRWPGPLDDRLGHVYVAVRTALAFVLTWLNPFFAVFAVLGYFDPEVFVKRRWYPAVAVPSALTMAGSQSGGFPPQSMWQGVGLGALFVLNTGLVLLFARIGAREEDIGKERTRTIEELETTNRRLQETLAENAALQARVVQQARLSGVHEERERLALEIHDTIAQGLTGIVTQLQAADDAGDDGAALDHRKRAADLAREALGEARRSVQALQPSALDRLDLGAAVAHLVADWSSSTGLVAELTVTGEPQVLHDDVEATVLRVAQEALANVGRHALAQRVGVTLSFAGDDVVLDVRDDGVGFDATQPVQAGGEGGYGLAGMRRRAERVAGELVVESEPGHGTAVSLRVPALLGDDAR